MFMFKNLTIILTVINESLKDYIRFFFYLFWYGYHDTVINELK